MADGTTFSSGIRGSQAKLKELLENPNIDWATCRYFELSERWCSDSCNNRLWYRC